MLDSANLRKNTPLFNDLRHKMDQTGIKQGSNGDQTGIKQGLNGDQTRIKDTNPGLSGFLTRKHTRQPSTSLNQITTQEERSWQASWCKINTHNQGCLVSRHKIQDQSSITRDQHTNKARVVRDLTTRNNTKTAKHSCKMDKQACRASAKDKQGLSWISDTHTTPAQQALAPATQLGKIPSVKNCPQVSKRGKISRPGLQA